MSIRSVRAALFAALAGCVALGAAAPSYAALGAAPMQSSTNATSIPLRATAHAAVQGPANQPAPYTVTQTTFDSGTVVREYVSAAGTVFGIAWTGSRVDLTALLGSYFPQYDQALAALRATRTGRGPVAIDDSGLVVHSGGHMGSFAGQAWLPQALPAGVSGNDIQ
ncbi:DUF2844 domain-containing protein [Trinickia fusca]|uniref:DUF2844 domain-containing protein n=1 Tax=Trinickia fusca TaxID=2419777 RepID=A0A494X5M8_9BURK|nr:DUF2844 domain-containing protein [Trinickia fusca]RKP45632.1 DUF2844 domain-containing protein [Trinickia fusca]